MTIYSRVILKKPVIALTLILALIAALSPHIAKINIDASPDSLLLESDPDLEFYRAVHREYGSDEFIIVGFQPRADLFSEKTINFIQALSRELSTAAGVSAVTSLTNVPLLQQPAGHDGNRDKIAVFKNLASPDADIAGARSEFLNSPIYAANLVSLNAGSTALRISIKKNQRLVELLEKKYAVLNQLNRHQASQPLLQQLAGINHEIPVQRAIINQRYKDALDDIRAIVAKHQQQGNFYLAGAPLIANDIKAFIHNDIRIFGLTIIAVMLIVLWLFFKKASWVLLSLSCAFLNVLLVSGLIGLLGLQVTIISSNFVALLIIFSITLSIHVIIRYHEVACRHQSDLFANVVAATKQIAIPCLYMVATSAIAFISLIVSDIQPVIYFGLIMVMGLLCAFLLTFTVLPILILLVNPEVKTTGKPSTLLAGLINPVMSNKAIAVVGIAAMGAAGLYGITQLSVENRFIDYFADSTEIHKGLVFVDRQLGGTVPLEILLQAPEADSSLTQETYQEDDEFADYLNAEEDNVTQQSYWYNRRGIQKISAVHDYLENLHQVGKVLSLASTEKVFRQVARGAALEDFHLALIHKKAPAGIKAILIDPYLSQAGDQARIVARIKDSDHTLIRNDLLNKIEDDINRHLLANGEGARLSGISVLYNNVLQSLYRSQIVTLGTVFICILLMLLVLFRSFSLAVIGTLPNIFTAFIILGAMGLLKIPLDIMTITIAAITIGIGVDYAIHYIHRFKSEVAQGADYQHAGHTVQTTVGRALYYTSITITLGFITLVSSNFKPSIYFGLFTSIAMMVSLLATFIIIPLLIDLLKPVRVR